MGYADDREEEMRQIQADPELAAALAEDERRCAAGHDIEIALEVIRLSYQCTNEESNRYGLPVLREEAWRVVAAGLTELRSYRMQIVAVAPRWRGRRGIPRFKAVWA